MKVKFFAILLVVSIIVSVCGLFACNDSDDVPTTPTLDTFVSIDINPSIEMTVNSDNKVVSIYGANDDGKMLLYGESDLVGVELEVAVEKIVKLAVQYDYLNAENSVVTTSVTSKNSDVVSELNAKVNAKIAGTASNLGLSVTTDTEGSFVAQCEMEDLREQFPNNQAVQNMTFAKYKLAMTVVENSNVEIETAVAMDDATLIANVKSIHDEIEPYALEEYKRAEEEANILYQKSVEFAKDMTYVEFFAEKFLSNPFSNAGIAYFGALYCMYSLPAKGFEFMAKIGKCISDYKKEPLSEEEIERIMQALKMEESEIDSLKDLDGNITINSVENYVNILFKTSALGVELEEIKADVKEVLSDVKTEVKESISAFKETYKEEIEVIIETAESYVTTVESLVLALPDSVKTEINRYLTDFKDVVVGVKNAIEGGLTIEELTGYADSLKTKAVIIREDMLAKLSDEEKSDIAYRQEQAVAKLSKERQEWEQSIETAKQNAKTKIAEIKAKRANVA